MSDNSRNLRAASRGAGASTSAAGAPPVVSSRTEGAGGADDGRMTVEGFASFFADANRGAVGTLLPEAIGYNIGRLVDEWNLSMNTEGAIVAGMAVILSESPGHGQRVHENNPPEPTWFLRAAREGADGRPSVRAVSLTRGNPSHEDFADESAWFRIFLDALSKSKGYLVDLVACNQVKKLNASNVKNYMAAQGNRNVGGSSIALLVDVASTFYPQIMASDTLRAMVEDTSFTRYHTTAVSTPGLMMRVIENLGRDAANVFPLDVIETVKVCIDEHWDTALTGEIPQVYIAITRAFLEATGRLPENWWQGMRALNVVSPTSYNAMKSFFLRYAALTSRVESMTEAGNIDALFAAAGDLFRGAEVVAALAPTAEESETAE